MNDKGSTPIARALWAALRRLDVRLSNVEGLLLSPCCRSSSPSLATQCPAVSEDAAPQGLGPQAACQSVVGEGVTAAAQSERAEGPAMATSARPEAGAAPLPGFRA